jgi:hypothetical protein
MIMGKDYKGIFPASSLEQGFRFAHGGQGRGVMDGHIASRCSTVIGAGNAPAEFVCGRLDGGDRC